MTERRRKLAPPRPEPMDHINRMCEDILAQIARDIRGTSLPTTQHLATIGETLQKQVAFE